MALTLCPLTLCPYATLMRSKQPARGLSLDVSTLKAARLNMHLFDNASQSLKARRVAGL